MLSQQPTQHLVGTNYFFLRKENKSRLCLANEDHDETKKHLGPLTHPYLLETFDYHFFFKN